MAHKTFISYKYSEATDLRDAIIDKLGDDSQFYKGETSDSPDLTDTSTENIKKNLKDMMYDTSVTILIISPKIKESKWINWEIEYCLKGISRSGRTSKKNGVVAVIMKVDGSYDWFMNSNRNIHGKSTISYNEDLVYPIIKENRWNSNPKKWHCAECRTYDRFKGSYISYIKEDDFLSSPQMYIDKAFDKSENTEDYIF